MASDPLATSGQFLVATDRGVAMGVAPGPNQRFRLTPTISTIRDIVRRATNTVQNAYDIRKVIGDGWSNGCAETRGPDCAKSLSKALVPARISAIHRSHSALTSA